ncbi:MAG TPA: hypothetical protein VL651_04240, partial [Bacteroidia bacterium]|nr:hypothetical protein [Bacteroidia bacterium]
MRTILQQLLLSSIISLPLFSQRSFPQDRINAALQTAFLNSKHGAPASVPANSNRDLSAYLDQMTQLRKDHFDPYRIQNDLPQPQALDTVIVGLVPNDTLRITGNWNHTGPIWVLGTGVLIFHNATVHDTGDVIVFQNGKWLADSTSFFFPQNYFYERTFLLVQNGVAVFDHCSTNYSGMSHGLTVAGNASMTWNDMHNDDWTTCGLNGHASMSIHNCNVSGEYILYDTCTANFIHADTIILWHQMPATAVVNYGFPSGNPVYNYDFNNSIAGVSGLNYSVHADSCVDVMWALMPVNGSDVTLSNSTIRLIGAWFMNGDITTAHGIFNNSSYTNYITPLADRNLHLINSSVQTWSMYLFDSSQVIMDSCQFGEIGTQQESYVSATNVLADGSGGYFWATDTSAVIATNCISYNTCRSERNGLFILGYSWLPFTPPTSINNSEIICVQNTLVADPVPYDASVAWLEKIDGPDTTYVNSIVPLNGSAWINQGPLGNPIDFSSYSLYWQYPAVSQNWYQIVIDSS